MLYPLVWQLTEFPPLATAFETILSEFSLPPAEPTSDCRVANRCGCLMPNGGEAVDSPGRGGHWLTRIRRPGCSRSKESMRRQLSATSTLCGFMFGVS